MEKAISKMTERPARRLGLTNRGSIRSGYWADVVVFDPDTVKDKATYKDPWQNSIGIEYVFINGRLAVEHGELTGERAGKVLRKGINT
jgi:N-acyl-D-amino-acid deacylase